jgi:hypothetical protein
VTNYSKDRFALGGVYHWLGEVRIPIPRDEKLRADSSKQVESAITRRPELREQARRLTIDVKGRRQ